MATATQQGDCVVRILQLNCKCNQAEKQKCFQLFYRRMVNFLSMMFNDIHCDERVNQRELLPFIEEGSLLMKNFMKYLKDVRNFGNKAMVQVSLKRGAFDLLSNVD